MAYGINLRVNNSILFIFLLFFMYSSIPPCELSIEWENLVHDNKEKKKIILVAPNQENENVQKFIREVAEILENSNTFTCIMLIKTDLIYKFIKNAP